MIPVRVLFATTAGAGHFGPSIPVARACVDAGHEVVVAAPAGFADHVHDAGFALHALPDVPAEQMSAVYAPLPRLSRREANRIVIGEIFGRLDAQTVLPSLLDFIPQWRPDVVVRDPAEFGSLVAAARHKVPLVQVAIGVRQTWEDAGQWLDEPVRELEAIAGVPERGIARAHAAATLSSVPTSLDELPGGEVSWSGERGPTWRYQVPIQVAGPALPDEWGDAAQPLVYVSFGSVTGFQGRFDDLYPQVLRALADLPIRVLMTTGRGLEPTAFGSLTPNAYVTQWWPQDAAMSQTALVVGHGGFGTTMSAVRAGVPQIVMPLFASDQFINAERIAAIGAGEQLLGGLEAVTEVPAMVETVLAGSAYAGVAEALAAETGNLPEVGTMVDVLQELASGA